MRKSSVEATFGRFFVWMDRYGDFINRVYKAKNVVGSQRDKKELFEAFVFKFHIVWEILVEELLIDCLNHDSSQYAKYMDMTLPKHATRNQCKAMIYGLKHLDFRSVSEVKTIARGILVPEHNPFVVIPKSNSNKIDEFYRIRNYLAHYSITARRSLGMIYRRRYGLQRFREPGDFLLCWDRKSGQTRFGNYVDAFVGAAEKMAQFCGIETEL